ncbi:MAG: T9SS type A sorting domain-containing protein [Flavobacteriales bacterium]|nr:T9SS type A sorting domain-containing protein [Flavobacteriales bacterium]
MWIHSRTLLLFLFFTLMAPATRAQFGAAQVILTGDDPDPVHAIDVDHDGDLDLVRTRIDQGLLWYADLDGLGTFGPPGVIIPPPFEPTAWYLVDLGTDGLLDLIYHDPVDNTIKVALALGAGLFEPATPVLTLAGTVQAMTTAEISGDGLVDLVLLVSDGSGGNELHWAMNTGTGFGTPQATGVTFMDHAPLRILVADIDQIGGTDLITWDADQNVVVLLNAQGDGSTWVTQVVFNSAASPLEKPQLIDVDADGDLDLAEARFPAVHWMENTLDEGGQLRFWVDHQIAAWTTAGEGSFGHFGCGPGAGVMYRAANPNVGMLWSHWLPELNDLAFPNEISSPPIGSQPLLADLNGDGHDDLILFENGERLWYPSTLTTPTTILELPALEPLCKFGPGLPLPEAIPAGGHWSGPSVIDDVLHRSLLWGQGTIELGHAYYEPAGCPVGANADILVVDGPMITPAIGPVLCSGQGPIQLTSTPPAAEWFGIGPDAVIDPTIFHGGVIAAMFIDGTGTDCASETEPLVVWTSLAAEITPHASLCINSGPQLITILNAPPFGISWGGAIESWNSVGATFLPDQGAGTYPIILHADATQPGQCDGVDTLWLSVSDVFPEILITPVAPLCTTSAPLDLSPFGTPFGGFWSGPGITNGEFDPAQFPSGEYFLTYSYFAPEGCGASNALPVTVASEAVVTTNAADLILCATDGPIQFVGSPAGGTWAAPIDANGVLDPAITGPGDYPVVYAYSNGPGCLLLDATATLSVWTTTTPIIDPVGAICTTDDPVAISGSPDGTWSGSVNGSGPSVWLDPSALGAGLWPVTLTAAHEGQCPGSTTVDLLIEVCTGLSDPDPADLGAVPNPFTDRLTITVGSTAVLALELVDATGRRILAHGPQSTGSQLVLDLGGVPSGAYLLRVTRADGAVWTIRLLKV